MADPFREPQLPPSEVRRTLRRAADLAEHDPSTSGVERPMTRDELERVAGELGLPASSIARAIDPSVDSPGGGPPRGKRPWLLGAPTRLIVEAEVAGEPSESQREDLIEEIRDAVGEAGTIESMGKSLSFRLNAGASRRRDLSVRLRSRDGRTRIVVEERLGNQAAGLFFGLGFGGGLGPMGAYIAALAKLGVVGLVFPLLWIPTMIVLARTIFGMLARRRTRTLTDVMERLKRSAAHWSTVETRARVDVVKDASTTRTSGSREGQALADADAEVETEASVAPSRSKGTS
jgi:hypothetical protein